MVSCSLELELELELDLEGQVVATLRVVFTVFEKIRQIQQHSFSAPTTHQPLPSAYTLAFILAFKIAVAPKCQPAAPRPAVFRPSALPAPTPCLKYVLVIAPISFLRLRFYLHNISLQSYHATE